MSTTTYVEATSADPFVRQLHRSAMRVLNDPSLDRQQRELHVRRLQSILLEHQSKEAAKAKRRAKKESSKVPPVRSQRNQAVADQSQLLARRKEFGQTEPVMVPAETRAVRSEGVTQQTVAVNDKQMTGRRRPVLSLKGA